MSDNYVGEIRLFAGNYAPEGWHFCDGSELPISQYDVLYSVIGTTYGGNGSTTFKLPDLRGRVPLHQGQGTGLTNRPLGSQCGEESVALTSAQIPAHSHTICVGDSGTTLAAVGNYPANSVQFNRYSSAQSDCTMSGAVIGASSNAGLAHGNIMPSLCINYIIALTGYYPERS